MKTVKLIHPLALAAVLALNYHARAAGDADNLPPIFNGQDFTGWKVPAPNPFWKVVGGIIVGENDEAKKGSMLWTERSYGDFVIECEARWSGEIDSGIMVRKPELQMQMGVSRSLKRDLTGSFYTGGTEKYPETGQAKNLEKHFKPGDWNLYRLEARGDTFTVWLNGVQVSKYTNAKYAGPAPIGLQIHPGLAMKVEFRNLRAKALE
ncbi:MAG: DUF1080 domain-containing protein [Verrucomicrobiota bacterium]|nr:DUF1080 domain-containing protein [Verrucomicrobiota bacterium]MCC6823081.1 DUF1080 domain-containing protein [Limisphaerales bacterium]